ncbi:hypothetical protein ACVRW4_06465 [Streptococcus phocae subsp. phocae]|uniref:Bacteriocin immunity protein n=1 Tax=Streptococcus phocae TaxID=119224 RepID=A0A0P6SK62_9STRE|nr:hypothetical protein [Streptococcus phocae]KPJ22740.1 hypothetical protein AKK44_03595 [Streptococcus phocae]
MKKRTQTQLMNYIRDIYNNDDLDNSKDLKEKLLLASKCINDGHKLGYVAHKLYPYVLTECLNNSRSQELQPLLKCLEKLKRKHELSNILSTTFNHFH